MAAISFRRDSVQMPGSQMVVTGEKLIVGGKDSFFNEFLPKGNPKVEVNSQCCNRGAPDRCPAHQARPIPAEMMTPLMPPRVEQGNHFLGQGIHTR